MGDTTRIASKVAISVPQAIGEYRVTRRIARGGMGMVYEATHQSTGEVVALKVLNPAVTSSSVLKRFETESKILERLVHPNIARVHEAGVLSEGSESIPYFVMEFVPDAKPITEYVKSQRLGIRERLKLFCSVCAAVHYGNQRGIVHRDLKPDNILVDSAGTVKVIDFGVARTTDSDLAATSQMTHTGELIGTLAYMSPEQVKGKARAIDEHTDVYSLGVVLFELLSDRLPYDVEGKAEYEVLKAIQEHSPKRLADFNPSIDGDLDALVHAALRKDPRWRYHSTDELRQNIQRYLDHESVFVPKPTFKTQIHTTTRTFVRRHPIYAYLIAWIVAITVANYVGFRFTHQSTNFHIWYLRTMLELAKPDSVDQPFEHVRVIRMTDDTGAQIERIAKREGLAGVTQHDRTSWRRVHGRLMEKLAQSGVRVVAFNLSFSGLTQYDDSFVRGVRALKDAGIDVIISVPGWDFETGGSSNVSPAIRPHVQWGSATLAPTDIYWVLDLVVQREQLDPLASFATVAVASFHHPQFVPSISFNPPDRDVQINFYKQVDPHDPRAKEWLTQSIEIKLSGIELIQGASLRGLQSGDWAGHSLIVPRHDHSLAASSIEYESIFEMDESALRDRLGSKVAVIGYALSDEGIHPAFANRAVHGIYGHAAAIETCLQRRPILDARSSVLMLSMGAFGLLGIILSFTTNRARWLPYLLLVLTIVMALVASAFVYLEWQYVFNPFAALLALVVACVLAIQIYRFHPLSFTRSSQQ